MISYIKVFAASQLFIMCALGQNVFESKYPIDPTILDETALTVEYKPNPNFKVCQCDMVQGSCDPFCCCDEKDCPSDFVNQWIKDKQCANETYDSTKQIISGIDDCFESDENEYQFNEKRGLQTYYSPFSNLFCIRFNNAPEMGKFYSANTTKPTPAELRTFERSKDHSLRALAFTEEQGDVGERNYQVGEKMKSKLELTVDGTVDATSRTQYSDAFPFPRADSFGNCNNFGSVYFMQDDQSSCQQFATLNDALSDCDTVLNAEYYTKHLKVFTGIRGTANQVKSVETATDIWTYNGEGVYTKKPDSTSILSVAESNSGTCTCKNAVKEVEYTFLLEREDGKNFYSFNKAATSKSKLKARVILYENDISAPCGERVGVQQSFKISFKTGGDALIQKRSGNPGYMDGYPFLLGKQSTAGKVIESYIDGFQITGADKNGKCFDAAPASGSFRDLDDPVVKFNTDLSYGCSRSFSYDELKDFCQNPQTQDNLKDYPIFSALKDMQAFGIYGNADIRYIKDWQYLNNDDSFNKLGAVQWFEANKTCKVNGNVQLKVLYHNNGYGEHPQRYIIDMKRYSKAEYWQWPADEIPHSRKLNFDLLVNVQFVDYLNIFQDEDGFIPIPSTEFDKMMFYPAFLRSFTSATSLKPISVYVLGGAIALSSLLLLS